MNFNDLDFSQLPSSGEEAFVAFEKNLINHMITTQK